MNWKPTQVYWAMLLSLLIGVGSTYDVMEQHSRHDGQQREWLRGRIAQLEGELAHLRADNDDLRSRLSDAAERERAAKVRASRSRRSTVFPAVAWAHQTFSIKVANCESADLQHWPYSDGTQYIGGEKGIHLRDPNGHDGKWQFAPETWRSVGGVGSAADATEAEQDFRAWLLWKRDGWWPTWSCAHKV